MLEDSTLRSMSLNNARIKEKLDENKRISLIPEPTKRKSLQEVLTTTELPNSPKPVSTKEFVPEEINENKEKENEPPIKSEVMTSGIALSTPKSFKTISSDESPFYTPRTSQRPERQNDVPLSFDQDAVTEAIVQESLLNIVNKVESKENILETPRIIHFPPSTLKQAPDTEEARKIMRRRANRPRKSFGLSKAFEFKKLDEIEEVSREDSLLDDLRKRLEVMEKENNRLKAGVGKAKRLMSGFKEQAEQYRKENGKLKNDILSLSKDLEIRKTEFDSEKNKKLGFEKKVLELEGQVEKMKEKESISVNESLENAKLKEEIVKLKSELYNHTEIKTSLEKTESELKATKELEQVLKTQIKTLEEDITEFNDVKEDLLISKGLLTKRSDEIIQIQKAKSGLEIKLAELEKSTDEYKEYGRKLKSSLNLLRTTAHNKLLKCKKENNRLTEELAALKNTTEISEEKFIEKVHNLQEEKRELEEMVTQLSSISEELLHSKGKGIV
eukprot:snap_masked-scaffold_2-processed-gene-25.10-mRNA-1 protein AED:1.00 eAED:1.00 QI:0/-1/0/0/-1/1/1/0/500